MRPRDQLRVSCQRLLGALGHPVHYGILACIIQAHTGLKPTKMQVISALKVLRAEGLVRRVRAGVYEAPGDVSEVAES